MVSRLLSSAGAPLSAVLIHGRGRTPAEMIGLAERIGLPEVAWRALQAPDNSWYPGSFLEPVEANQPELDRSLAQVEAEVRVLEALGAERRRIALAKASSHGQRSSSVSGVPAAIFATFAGG